MDTEKMNRPLKVGVVGLGSMGRNHLRVYSEMADVQMAAVADVDAGALQRAAEAYSVATYQDYRRMLERERLDAVSIVAPTGLHRQVALAAAQAGVHILVEKPIAPSVEEGLAILEAAGEAGVKVMVGHIERFNPAVTALGQRLDEGALGRVYQVQARRIGPFAQRVRDVGVVYDLATHDIDVMRFLLRSQVRSVYAQVQAGIKTDREDALLGLLQFEDDVVGFLDVNWLSPLKVRELLVLGERGLFRLDYIRQELAFYQSCPRAKRRVGRPPALSPDPTASGAAPQSIPIEKEEPLQVELEAFLAAVRADTETPVSGADAIVALHIAERLVESARQGVALDVLSPLASASQEGQA